MTSTIEESNTTQPNPTSNQEEKNKKLDYELLREDYPTFDLSFKVIVIGNSGIYKLYIN